MRAREVIREGGRGGGREGRMEEMKARVSEGEKVGGKG